MLLDDMTSSIRAGDERHERMKAPLVLAVDKLRSIQHGSDHDGRWLDANGNECDEDDEDARWEPFTVEEQKQWLETVAADAAQACEKLESLCSDLGIELAADPLALGNAEADTASAPTPAG